MSRRGGNAAEQGENDKADFSHCIFHIVTEDPEVKHISSKVKKTTMQKHGSKQGCDCRDCLSRSWSVSKQICRHQRKSICKRLAGDIPQR